MRNILLPVLFLCWTVDLSAQELVFCERIGKDGVAEKTASHFFVDRTGSAVTFVLRNRGPFDCDHIIIDLYEISTEKKERFDRSLKLKVLPYQRLLTGKFLFDKAGSFTAYAYDERGKLLGTGKLTLLFRK